MKRIDIGVKSGNILTAIDLLMGRHDPGKSVVVMGVGLIGYETALHLATMGRKVTVAGGRRLAHDTV